MLGLFYFKGVMPLFDSIPLYRAVSNQAYSFILLTYGREEADKLLYVEPVEVQHDTILPPIAKLG